MRNVSKEVDTTTTKMMMVTKRNHTTTTATTYKSRALPTVTRMTISNNIERRIPTEVINHRTIEGRLTIEEETSKKLVKISHKKRFSKRSRSSSKDSLIQRKNSTLRPDLTLSTKSLRIPRSMANLHMVKKCSSSFSIQLWITITFKENCSRS